MVRRKRAKGKVESAPREREPSLFNSDVIQGVATGAFAAMCVCTPLIPSESAASFGALVVLVMLWLLLLLAWSAIAVLKRTPWSRLQAVDLAVLIFFALHTLSAVVMARHGHPRPVINTLWQWLAMGVTYLLTRQLLRGTVVQRAVCASLVGLAAGLAAVAFYQFFISGPALRADFDRDPAGMLRRAGIEAALDSPEAVLFRDRIQSTEPTATFALTNSLAGFLAPWLIFVLGVGVVFWRNRESSRDWRVVIGVALCVIALGFCLLLTKSRTAVLATGLGVGLLALEQLRSRGWIGWRVLVVGGLLIALLFAATVFAGAFDLLVLSEAPKSVLYRLEYWEATLRMIGDHPWFGCGPGSFQAFYPEYKLPQASETVADPHNFVLEVWATAGIFAGLAFLSVLALWAKSVSARGASETTALPSETCRSECDSVRRWVYGGSMAGVLLAYPCGMVTGFAPDPIVLLIVPVVAAVVVWLLDPWVLRGGRLGWPCTVAVLVLMLNLLAAGGIGFTGVAVVFWLLLALSLNAREQSEQACAESAWPGFFMLPLALLSVVGCYMTMYGPVLKARAQVAEGIELQAHGQMQLALAAFERAAAADSYSAEADLAIAGLLHGQWLDTGDARLQPAFEASVERALSRQRHSHVILRQVGDWRWEQYRAGGDPERADAALDAYRQAADLYPNSAFIRAQLAWCLHESGDLLGAAQMADSALRLDGLTPHRDKKLASRRVFEPENARLEGCGDAEQLMRRLRRNRAETNRQS